MSVFTPRFMKGMFCSRRHEQGLEEIEKEVQFNAELDLFYL